MVDIKLSGTGAETTLENADRSIAFRPSTIEDDSFLEARSNICCGAYLGADMVDNKLSGTGADVALPNTDPSTAFRPTTIGDDSFLEASSNICCGAYLGADMVDNKLSGTGADVTLPNTDSSTAFRPSTIEGCVVDAATKIDGINRTSAGEFPFETRGRTVMATKPGRSTTGEDTRKELKSNTGCSIDLFVIVELVGSKLTGTGPPGILEKGVRSVPFTPATIGDSSGS